MKRYGRVTKLRAGAEAEYDRLHAGVWPEVLAVIARTGIRNYSIFRNGRQLFSYFELPENADLAEVTRLMMDDAACRKWEDQMLPLQVAPGAVPGRTCWVPMKEIFHT